MICRGIRNDSDLKSLCKFRKLYRYFSEKLDVADPLWDTDVQKSDWIESRVAFVVIGKIFSGTWR